MCAEPFSTARRELGVSDALAQVLVRRGQQLMRPPPLHYFSTSGGAQLQLRT